MNDKKSSVKSFFERDGIYTDATKAANMILCALSGSSYEYIRLKYNTKEEFGHILLAGGLVIGKFSGLPEEIFIHKIADSWVQNFKYQASTAFSIWKDVIEHDNQSDLCSEHLKMIEGLEKAYALFEE